MAFWEGFKMTHVFEVLGASWGGLGPFWEPLGAVLGDLGVVLGGRFSGHFEAPSK